MNSIHRFTIYKWLQLYGKIMLQAKYYGWPHYKTKRRLYTQILIMTILITHYQINAGYKDK